ncbi:hypothetical protein BKA66DRAFT_544045 [Pyrenochaeta sp. MPI-SDFR-AT-0127]|nr:hypothetical protein BKA66DRAFT_544045 [Pyrenochaeta sp. MPI-SDFR-AT-0127]
MALETAAAIIGIMAAAGKVAETLGPVVSAFGDVAKNAAAVLVEVNHMRIILSALHSYLDDLESSPRVRRQLIQVDQLVATLTDGVLLFSELEALVLTLPAARDGVWDRTRYAWNESKFASIKSRMQCFKSSITVMLNILQCESDQEARRSRNELLAVMSILVESNHELRRRLARLETCSNDAESIITYRPGSVMTYQTAFQGTMPNLNYGTSAMPLTDSQFERILEVSRVYRRATNCATDASFHSSVVRSHAWTVLSGISLSDISVISVIGLPIQSIDLTNAERYHFRDWVTVVDGFSTASDRWDPAVPSSQLRKIAEIDPMFTCPFNSLETSPQTHITRLEKHHGPAPTQSSVIVVDCVSKYANPVHLFATRSTIKDIKPYYSCYHRPKGSTDSDPNLDFFIPDYTEITDEQQRVATRLSLLTEGQMWILIYHTSLPSTLEYNKSMMVSALAHLESIQKTIPIVIFGVNDGGWPAQMSQRGAEFARSIDADHFTLPGASMETTSQSLERFLLYYMR